MRNAIFKFVVERHDDTGELGLRPEHIASGEPFSGMTTAHDILEHFRDDDGSLEAEFEAIGAMLYVRGTDYRAVKWPKFGPSSMDRLIQDIAVDISRLYREVEFKGYEHTTRLEPREVTDEAFVEEVLSGVTAQALLDLVNEKWHNKFEYAVADAKSFFDKSIHWMRRGYNRANRRYKSDTYSMCCLFINIENAVDKFLRDTAEVMIGETVRIRVNYDRLDTEILLPRYAEAY